jgi:hypothetical protein
MMVIMKREREITRAVRSSEHNNKHNNNNKRGFQFALLIAFYVFIHIEVVQE